MQPLPIDPLLPAIRERLRSAPNLVLQAPPGAGKTTRVPPALLEVFERDVLVLEPRRLAARLAARRVASELGERPGETAGYQVRFEDISGPRTRLLFMTEGVLTRRLLSDPLLRGVSAVLLDEFHERHLEGDLALALLRRMQRKARPSLRIAVMSATMDPAPVAAFLGGCDVLRAEGRQYPLSIAYTPASAETLEERVASAVESLMRDGAGGHTLVFLPGAAEIRRAARACEGIARKAGALLLPLHGDLPPEEQDRAVQPSAVPRIILSTNVAESSVTIEGVTAVVDSGLARIAGQSPWSGLPRVTISRISKASADQRAGRAGRTAPGRVIRLYTQEDYLRRPERDVPEIARAELSQTVLELAALRIRDLEWFEAPPVPLADAARELLARLGALDASGRLSADGESMAQLPLHPRLGRLVLSGRSDRACRIAAFLSSGERLPGFDLLAAVDGEMQPRTRQIYNQIRRLAPRGGSADEGRLRMAVLAAFPDRVARRRGEADLFLSNGGSAQWDRPAAAMPAPEFLAAVDVEERAERGLPLVRTAVAIEPGWLLDLFPDRIRERTSLEWNRTAERVEEARLLLYDELVLDETRGAPSDAEAAARLLAERALAAGIGRFTDPAELERFLARAAYAAQHSDLPAIDDDAVRDALVGLCAGLRSFSELQQGARGGGLLRALEARLPMRKLDAIAPDRIRLPGGKAVKVNYARGQAPWVAAKLQEFFGMTESPRAGGEPIVLHLLAPNNRPVQTTTDLAGFWKRLYPEIRRELSRRYPRHRWPEDPLSAQPGERIGRRTGPGKPQAANERE